MGVDLSYLGIPNTGQLYRNLSTPALYDEAIGRREALLAHLGSLVVRTGRYTGRSSDDRLVARKPGTEALVWWGKENRPFSEERFARLLAYLQGRDLFLQDCYAGADPQYRLSLGVVTETAWHSLFSRNMFVRKLDPSNLAVFSPRFSVT